MANRAAQPLQTELVADKKGFVFCQRDGDFNKMCLVAFIGPVCDALLLHTNLANF